MTLFNKPNSTMSEEKNTDGGAIEEQTPQTEESLDDVSNAKPSEDTLNMDEILSKSKSQLKSKDERGDLSRKDVAKLKKEQETASDDRFLEIQQRLDSFESEREQFRQEVSEFKQLKAQTERERMETTINNTLFDNNISVTEFNSRYKDKFLAERDELIDNGMPVHKAIEKALKYTVGAVSTNERAEGRESAKLPPNSTAQGDFVRTVTSEKLSKLPQKEYDAVMKLAEEGKVRIK